jgi:hypothetical protein
MATGQGYQAAHAKKQYVPRATLGAAAASNRRFRESQFHPKPLVIGRLLQFGSSSAYQSRTPKAMLSAQKQEFARASR